CWSAGASEVGCGFCATLARESRNKAKTSRLAGFAKFIEHISLSGRIPLFILTHRLQTRNRVHHVRHGKNVENWKSICSVSSISKSVILRSRSGRRTCCKSGGADVVSRALQPAHVGTRFVVEEPRNPPLCPTVLQEVLRPFGLRMTAQGVITDLNFCPITK